MKSSETHYRVQYVIQKSSSLRACSLEHAKALFERGKRKFCLARIAEVKNPDREIQFIRDI
jgi:hypothetical protein